ncbi:glycosyltransferase family 2 protein [Ephemerocybe angulata]|uniref:chitin synthase n=1 Tax=Ephemerocybe angulata TaxID=980116 RepID=A0A8H6HPS8_9AGAR|nr:glycosyltransferase family 2 protein [Tulosesus angulatus]
MASHQTTQAIASGDLLELVSSSASAIIYPNDDAVLSVLQHRFRADLPYTRIGSTHLLVANPYKTLANVNEQSAKDYEERCYKDTSPAVGVDAPRPLQPHLYDVAAKMYLLMRRKKEAQAVVARGITGSGKTASMRLLTNQLLRLSAHSRKEISTANQVKAMLTILDSFGNAKTLMNPNASRHGRLLELHFSASKGRIAHAKVLTYNLDKSRLTRLTHEERTFHVFYQFLAGATPQERDYFNLEDPSDYALLASSGCYRLPSGPFSDDAIALGELRAALASMGFKPKHLQSIFTILSVVLLMSNLQFGFENGEAELVEQVARLLGLDGVDDFIAVLTTRTRYVRKELVSIILDKEGAEAQRDRCVRDSPTSSQGGFAKLGETIPILVLDQPGFQTRGPTGTMSVSLGAGGYMPFVSAYGTNGYEEFVTNFSEELVFGESVGLNAVLYEDCVASGVSVPDLGSGVLGGRGSCSGLGRSVVEMLRGAGGIGERLSVGAVNRASNAWKSKGGEAKAREEEMCREVEERVVPGYGSVLQTEKPSVSSPGVLVSFTVTHFGGPVTYTTENFVEKDADLMDASFVSLLRSSRDSFTAKLVSGPGLAAERHGRDEGIIAQAQVSSRPLRQPSIVWDEALKKRFPNADERELEERARAIVGELEERGVIHQRMDPQRIYGVLAQVGWTVSEILSVISNVLAPVKLSDLKTARSALTNAQNPFELPDRGLGDLEGENGRLDAVGIPSPGTRLFVVSHIRPNDSQSPNSFDKRRVKAQLRALGIADVVKRLSASPSSSLSPEHEDSMAIPPSGLRGDWTVAMDARAFCERYVGRMRGTDGERLRQCARAEGWRDGIDVLYLPAKGRGVDSVSLALGGSGVDGLGTAARGEDGERPVRGRKASISGTLRSDAMGSSVGDFCGRVWLTYDAWKGVEDGVRAMEKGGAFSAAGEYDEGDEGTMDWGHSQQQHGSMLTIPSAMYGGATGESNDNLLLSRTGADGSRYLDPNTASGYGAGGLKSPGQNKFGDVTPPYPDSPSFGGESKEDMGGSSMGGGGGGEEEARREAISVVKDASGTAVEEVPTSRTRRYWLWIVWGSTWLIPSFFLRVIGRMKRPDVRLAWREKFTIFWLILLLNAFVVFYIIEFGRLLCPNMDKAWDFHEVSQHQGENDWWIAMHGTVYDLSDYIWADHSDIANFASNTRDNLEQLAGQDLSYYFPPPLILACPGLVNSDQMELTYKNTSAVTVPLAMHTSGALQTQTTKMRNADWEYRKGPLVWSKSEIMGQAQDENIERIWASYNNKVYDLTDYVLTLTRNQNAGDYNFLDPDIVDVFKQRKGQDVTERMKTILAKKSQSVIDLNMNCLDNVFLWGEVDFRKTAKCQVQNYLLIIFSIILMSSMGLKFLAALQLTSKRSPELQDKFILCQVPCYTEGEDSLRRTVDSLAALNYDDKRKLIFIICDGNIIGSGSCWIFLGVDPNVDPEPLLFKSIGEGSKALNYGKVYSGLYEFEGHVVPLGKPTERSKPGNRGKRDSQILLMHYLNRLEIYHQMRNVIGIDPAFYEYIFTIDADTTVTPDSLNRLVASSADDSSIIGICGETKLTNEQTSWWTMIQVYEYYISHHLNKAFESLFGSVTCLPGCFSLYRIRTADKGRPIIISNRIIEEYAEPNVDTLHKKNLFSLGEDRFLTTLLMKHFPQFKTKFCPDAIAHTMAPESWRVLFSQRRRWINSTLVLLPELFGFCCFSMSTMILPATVVYASALPRIAIIMLAVVYGLQAIIFILKREFMLIGWMVVYIVSYPVYSFFLPVYSFWCMDEFSWGNTRLVVGEADSYRFVLCVLTSRVRTEYEAEAWETGSKHSDDTEGESPHNYQQGSQAGDYYRDTNLPMPLPFMPFPGWAGSAAGSEYGGMPPAAMMGYQNTGSVYGMAPRNTMMPNMFGGGGGFGGGMMGGSAGDSSQQGVPMAPFAQAQPNRPMSMFSMATSVNPFAGPSTNANPTDEELFNALRNYLSTQDLMSVTKKTAREAIMAKFPRADLTGKKEFLNQSIDRILSEA